MIAQLVSQYQDDLENLSRLASCRDEAMDRYLAVGEEANRDFRPDSPHMRYHAASAAYYLAWGEFVSKWGREPDESPG